jgi:hypothetical protein
VSGTVTTVAETREAPFPGVSSAGVCSAGAPSAGVVVSRYLSRPGRRVLVAADLADLHGPSDGLAELPLRLFWSVPGHRFDLGDLDARRWYYETVLREASRAGDLSAHLHGATLARLWPELYLPKGVRRAWEERHPSLRAAVAA